ncbi:hypothetical protein JXA88_09975 [Candidatus Fermentibacteria bacterium]|nr:hypothetical protein [Candidatus Fermentibacteria bacterium]
MHTLAFAFTGVTVGGLVVSERLGDASTRWERPQPRQSEATLTSAASLP